MPRTTAGVMPYLRHGCELEVFLVHPGGPFWAGRDDGAWSIAKGHCDDGEDPLDTARREFTEETGLPVPGGALVDLGELRQPSGKRVHVWAVETTERLRFAGSNLFSAEWPPHSGVIREFPEVDRADWFALETARGKLVPGQRAFLDHLVDALS